MQSQVKLNFKPRQVAKRLLGVLPERSKDVLISRFGLGSGSECMTLEAIGDVYGITRERVRQIENHALDSIRKSAKFSDESLAFEEFKNAIDLLGCVVAEDYLLEILSKDAGVRNYLLFLLVLGDSFMRLKEDQNFRSRWHTDPARASMVQDALDNLAKHLNHEDLIPEEDFVSMFAKELSDFTEAHSWENSFRRWLYISKKIDKNPLGEWGLASSPNVRVKGIRDYAYLTIRRHGSPMHFSEVSRAILRLFGRPAHEATCHNELIKDRRFVLVGRGLYALAEWGYAGGVVRDVIREVIRRDGPLSRAELIDRVLKERYVKENTVLVNLENPNYFRKNEEGKYILAD